MLKHILRNFLKDRALLIVFYLVNMACIITFFHLSEPANTEFIYPLSIGLFLLTIYLLIDWLRYYQVNQAILLKLKNQFAELEPHTEEQKAFQQLLTNITRENSSKYNEMQEQNKERFYFLSHWMHYLKTPVSVIELIIGKEEKTKETAEVFEKIQIENNRLHSSIEQALTMIRMEGFENDLEVKSVDLLPSLRKVINGRKRECIYQSIFPAIEFEGNDAYVVTDSKWNEVLLDQIIANAIKYSSLKDGSKKLVFRINKGEKYTTLSITDEGAGIPPHDLESVFQPFFTGENGRNFSNSTGIGLYLCRKIAEKLGQTINIQSNLNEGTTVTVSWLTGKESLAK
ncbi:histidine kinase [Virgibacillus profundi]|uniref:histidine kinase n=1 Tax=Virgibacillus profundi TaxID=2024555 RepID=A0A2A2I9G9_9BACI|nr:sensor histidine kinase [Virgibacillus profundi]PAV28222.1 histidine kinase [Virgibacillus profundi]PXY52527.1 sensor histidine kinase [Virgibacillus profundi]